MSAIMNVTVFSKKRETAPELVVALVAAESLQA